MTLEHQAKTDQIATRLYSFLQNKCNEIEIQINKINHKIYKRGLVNLLGKGIKFITGNPDNDDLENINKNIQRLFSN